MMARWLALGLVLVLAGGASYWLYTEDRIYDIAGVFTMAAMAAFFYAGDARVDELFAQDARKAQREANS